MIINAKPKNKDPQSQKICTVVVATDGDYYLSACINSPELIGETQGEFFKLRLCN